MNSNKYKYPNKYEIEQALSEFCTRSFMDNFSQNKGIFITGVAISDLAQFLSGLFFEHNDLEEIRKKAHNINEKSTLSGFLVHSKNSDFNLIRLFDNKRGGIVDLKKEMKLGSLIKTEQEKIYRGSVDYVYRKPGRVEFLHEDSRTFNYYIHELEQEKWKVLIECNKSMDAVILKDWVTKNTERNIEVLAIEQDMLTSMQAISFFDELAKNGLSEEWRFIQVKHLVLRRSDENETNEDEDVNQSELSGITQAILEGNDLRENSFVKKAEQDGYRFTAMTYEYENREKPYIIQISAEFKGRPKIFEIHFKSCKARSGIDGKSEDADLLNTEKQEICSEFWTKAKEIFDKIRSENFL